METTEQKEDPVPFYMMPGFKNKVNNSRIKQRKLNHFLKRVYEDKLITNEDHASLKVMVDSRSKEDRYIAQQILNFKIYGNEHSG